VQDPAASPFAAWESFYVIVGSSAAALTGLQFVVIALITETGKARGTREIAAFATPTIIHFGAVLLTSTILSAPWEVVSNAALAIGMEGAVGVAYLAMVTRGVMRQTSYRPVLEDWIWHTALPFVAYVMLVVAAVTLASHQHGSMFAIGAATVLLLAIGIHNAWDTVTYISLDTAESESKR
jgi:hypothetical protein